MNGERIELSRFRLGALYSRVDVAATGSVTPPTSGWDGTWASGIIKFDNATLLFVTLEKSEYTYHDSFDDDTFWWQSQSRQTPASRDLKEIAAGIKSTHLFARLREKYKGKATPFVYCGRLSLIGMTGSKPVTCRLRSLDYSNHPSEALAQIYAWRTPNLKFDGAEINRRTHIRSSQKETAGSRGQGHLSDVAIKLAIENHAMEIAKGFYGDLGFLVEDTSARFPYDLVCRRDDEEIRVEVKGTQGGNKSVEVTRAEVNSARDKPTDLFVVHGINAEKDSGEAVAFGGQVTRLQNWQPLDTDLTAKTFRYTLSHPAEPYDVPGATDNA
jgi:hypothetical protein